MSNPRISAIVAVGNNRELGRKNDVVWHIPDDFKRLKELSTGHPIIMGRKTHESIGRPLPNRLNIIVTRDKDYTSEGCAVAHTLNEALDVARATKTDEIFIFGGAQIYTEALPLIERLYLTHIDAEAPDADTFFPDYSEFKTVLEEEQHEHNGISFRFLTLER